VKYTPKIPVKTTTSAAAQRPEVSDGSSTVLDEMSPKKRKEGAAVENEPSRNLLGS